MEARPRPRAPAALPRRGRLGLIGPPAPALLAWAGAQGRDLPWRHTRDPWAVLVSEVMTQQTQVARVVPKWFAFLEAFPDPAACAAAPLAEVLRLWQGLGYPRRARNLQLAARAVAAAGAFPDTLAGLQTLPGVGPYTARAVLAFAYERDVAVVDTNVGRVLARRAGRALTGREVQALADEAVPAGEGWAWNQAMLDLGATVCAARTPACERCPVRRGCRWRGRGDDPAQGSARVSVRQARYEGSDRQLRGHVLRLAGPAGVTTDAVVTALGVDEARVGAVVTGLLGDGLLERRDGRLRLPGS